MTNFIAITGRLAADPDLRFTKAGKPVANARIGHTKRVKTDTGYEDGGTTWLGVTVWGPRAEQLAESASKGDEILVVGRLESREHDGKVYFDIIADEVVVSRKKGQGSSQSAPAASGAGDPWASGPASDSEPPF